MYVRIFMKYLLKMSLIYTKNYAPKNARRERRLKNASLSCEVLNQYYEDTDQGFGALKKSNKTKFLYERYIIIVLPNIHIRK
jgi:hypothetical protein